MISSGNTLYGTTEGLGGAGDFGTVYAFANGTGFSTLYRFSNNNYGAYPIGDLVVSGNTLLWDNVGRRHHWRRNRVRAQHRWLGFYKDPVYFYEREREYLQITTSTVTGRIRLAVWFYRATRWHGTTYEGGPSGAGTVFAINTNGSGFTNLHYFTDGSDGGYPYAGLIFAGNTLYGTTLDGGARGVGTVFAINTNSSNFSVLHSFVYASDGENPYASLVLAGDTLYGTAAYGGAHSAGTLFAIDANGSGFMNLHNFAAGGINASSYYTNIGGAYPHGTLFVSGSSHWLSGRRSEGGPNGNGTVFVINTNGSGFTELYHFSAKGNSGVNSDGAYPIGGLVLSGNTLYGTAEGAAAGAMARCSR